MEQTVHYILLAIISIYLLILHVLGKCEYLKCKVTRSVFAPVRPIMTSKCHIMKNIKFQIHCCYESIFWNVSSVIHF